MPYDEGEQGWEDEFAEFEEAEPETLPCPSCGAEVYEETQRCPHCGDWIMPLAASSRRKSTLWIVAAILMLLAILVFALR